LSQSADRDWLVWAEAAPATRLTHSEIKIQ
jgi:hypothetical protein